jgi:putative transposase
LYLEALKLALKQRKNKNDGLIHHSDQGVKYCSHSYVQLLQKNNIKISMTQTGDPKKTLWPKEYIKP